MLKPVGYGVIANNKKGHEKDRPRKQPGNSALLENRFFWCSLVNVAHNFTLHRFCTIPQRVGYVNG